jgi:hypothetical protein
MPDKIRFAPGAAFSTALAGFRTSGNLLRFSPLFKGCPLFMAVNQFKGYIHFLRRSRLKQTASGKPRISGLRHQVEFEKKIQFLDVSQRCIMVLKVILIRY